MGQKIAGKFISRILVGVFLSVFIGGYLDRFFHTKPWIMVILIAYVIIGSLILLVKESNVQKH